MYKRHNLDTLLSKTWYLSYLLKCGFLKNVFFQVDVARKCSFFPQKTCFCVCNTITKYSAFKNHVKNSPKTRLV